MDWYRPVITAAIERCENIARLRPKAYLAMRDYSDVISKVHEETGLERIVIFDAWAEYDDR